MKTQCFRCPTEFECAPSAHPPRFCDACTKILHDNATAKEKRQLASHKRECDRLARRHPE